MNFKLPKFKIQKNKCIMLSLEMIYSTRIWELTYYLKNSRLTQWNEDKTILKTVGATVHGRDVYSILYSIYIDSSLFQEVEEY